MQKFLLCLLLGISTSVYAQAWKTYIPYNQKGLWGYADTSCTIKIKPFSKFELDFFDDKGLAITTDSNGLKGVINHTMKTVLQPNYQRIEIEHGRYIKAETSDRRYRLFNNKGVQLLPYESDRIVFSKENANYVLVFSSSDVVSVYKYDVKLNKLLLLRKHPNAGKADFNGANSYDVTYHYTLETKTYNLISGKVVELIYEDALDPDDMDRWGGDEIVESYPNNGKKEMEVLRYAFTDTLPFTVVYDAAVKNYHNPNLMHVRIGKKWGVVSNTRKVIVPVRYDSILNTYNYSRHPTKNNDKVLGWICRLDGRVGIVSTDSNQNIPCLYDKLAFFSSKYIMARAKQKYGVLNHYGDTVIAFEVDSFKHEGINSLDWSTCSDELILFAVKDKKMALYGTRGGKTDYVLDDANDVRYNGLYGYTNALILKSGNLYGLALCGASGFVYLPCHYTHLFYLTEFNGYRIYKATLFNQQNGYIDNLGRRYFEE